jgi:flagellin-like protein
MKKTWAIRKDSEAVSPVIATILMVAITVVLAAVLYVMVLGFGGTSTTTPAATYSKQTVSGGQRINIVSITKTDVPWDDVKVQLSDGTLFAEWDTVTTDLDGGAAVTAPYGSDVMGAVTVFLNVTDVGGNGFVSGTDYIVLTGNFASGGAYSVALVYTVTGEKMGTGIAFNG